MPLLIVIGGVLVLAFFAYSSWKDAHTIIYPAGCWMELEDENDYEGIDDKWGPRPQYIRITNAWTKAKENDHWGFGPHHEYFEPNGKIDTNNMGRIDLYKPVGPTLAAKLEAARNKSVNAEHNANIAKVKARRQRALKLYLKA